MTNIVIRNAILFISGVSRERGIGRALVQEAIKRGAKKVYATARDISTLRDLTSLHDGIVIPLELDVTDKAQVIQVAKKAADTQILINNAGVSGYSGFCFQFNEEVARQELEVNYFGPLYLIRAFFKSLIHNKNGAIVNIVSIGGLSPLPLCATYSASKSAEHVLTQCVRAELAPHEISVFGVYPGPIDTDMADGIDMDKESPSHAAIRIFDGIEQGIEDITTDTFADDFVRRLRDDPKAVEKDIGSYIHKM